MAATDKLRSVPTGLLNGLLFFVAVLCGVGYIIVSKLQGFGAFYVTAVPVVIMIVYALFLGLARLLRVRDDQAGDNLYYMGFLFTLTSLAVSLYQFSADKSADQIVQNFGIAIASTIAGISLRIFFNQMRRDPVEVEHTARLELAEASRKVKRELECTVLEFAYFRRATQQSLTDALDEVNTLLKEARGRIIGQLDEFAASARKPLHDASENSVKNIEQFNDCIAEMLESVANQLAVEGALLSKSTTAIVKSVDEVAARLAALQTPEQIIEIKLNPMVQGLSRAVNTFSSHTEAQARAVSANLKQTHQLASAITSLLAEIREAEMARVPVTLPIDALDISPLQTEPGGLDGNQSAPELSRMEMRVDPAERIS
jgi:hypothetical protein